MNNFLMNYYASYPAYSGFNLDSSPWNFYNFNNTRSFYETNLCPYPSLSSYFVTQNQNTLETGQYCPTPELFYLDHLASINTSMFSNAAIQRQRENFKESPFNSYLIDDLPVFQDELYLINEAKFNNNSESNRAFSSTSQNPVSISKAIKVSKPSKSSAEMKTINESKFNDNSESNRAFSSTSQNPVSISKTIKVSKPSKSMAEIRGLDETPVITINGVKQDFPKTNPLHEIFFHFDNRCLKFSIS